MRRSVLTALVALSLLPATAAAQTGEQPRIPPGAKAGGQDVGNLTLSEAAAKLDSVFGARFARNVQVRVAGKRFTIHTKDVGFAFDALRSARRANIAAAKAPKAPDGSVAVDAPLATSLDAAKLAATVATIGARSTKAARDATVKITIHHLRVRQGRSGASVSAKRLGERIAAALANPDGLRILRGKRQAVHPKVRTRDLRRRYGTVITVSQSEFRLRLFKHLKFVKSYGVAVGQPAFPTPNGLFSIANKAVNPTWNVPDSPWAGALRNESVPGGSDANPLKARWMGIVNGVGIHGTAESGSIGSRASHGCIRMNVSDVIDLYPRVPLGTPVLIG